MPAKYSDKELNSLIFKAIVPTGLRPTSQGDVETMLDALGGEEPSEDKLERMLRKVRGEESVGFCDWESIDSLEKLTIRQEELVAFYRARGKELPPDIQAKLDEIRKRFPELLEQGNHALLAE